ncbi:sulfotransferase [Terricaulis sp.]|uniref:tetratricopeptide repeat-containing sulfotransferase family protein n=1 Tax=Terricaulis sp. TaxID=2768686 RepID=UPI003782E48C
MSDLRAAVEALANNPARAEEIARALLAENPNYRDALFMLSEALRRQGKAHEASGLLEPLTRASPPVFAVENLYGRALRDIGKHSEAAAAFARAAEAAPNHPHIWRDLSDELRAAGDAQGAEQALLRHFEPSTNEPRLAKVAQALQAGDAAAARPILDAYLAEFPSDIAALRMLAEAQARGDRPDQAEATLRRMLELAPGFSYARHGLSQLLLALGRYEEAHAEAEELMRRDPNKGAKRLFAATLSHLGHYDASVDAYHRTLGEDENQPRVWMSLGHALKTVGRTAEGVEAYKKSITLMPSLGESYWSLANLKSHRFSDADVAAMQAQLAGGALSPDDRVNMLYALGKAREDHADAAGAFAAYSEGAALRRSFNPHNADVFSAFVAQSKMLFTREFFAARAQQGDPAEDPIFIVGLPRAGSTLVEQILASHSAVEGTAELSDILGLTRRIAGLERIAAGGSYLELIGDLDARALRDLGQSYLDTTRSQRRLGRPFFINKMPNDFQHLGLIHLILPNAKIIDARRHPLACGWSCFKQHFAIGQNFTYDLTELGRYYADYVALMAHYDAVLPGRVHRVIHEALVTDPEPQIRALLDYCRLPFEDAVLRPHETQRAVRTASSEQVRKPISAKGLDDWKPYEPYLGPLKAALGPVLDAYPDPPS